ncbi:putative glycosyltransferase protein [Lunatimonas lonarensis]|uniref:Putative glycosyltransferase protein n=1 Tax=Lunatimonas lonarensis TaxID=1232681 RepID=R7ZZ26_9BACT|nr:glycosyltransferase family A protein [Lunatimonas lonarensis]EON79309.1 putative glycosyltransferase protein [Lunatimonas lonarensis]
MMVNKSNSLVSIVIPVFNKASFIRETLESALEQTYLNTEIIVINDGSTDGSLEILKEFGKKYPHKIFLIDSVNRGVSAANNFGIKASRGDYLQFLDADDLISSDKIASQMKLLSGKRPEVLASCEWVNFKDNKDYVGRFPYGVFQGFDSGLDLLLRFWDNQEMHQPAVYLTSRDLVLKAGLWDESLRINQDGEFFCRVLAYAGEVVFEPKGKVFYRQPGEGNVSQQRSAKAARSLLDSYIRYEKAVLVVEDSDRVRTALKKVYLKFVYDTFPDYPLLLSEAKNRIKQLGIRQSVFIGGPKFQFLSKYLGFGTALRLKRYIN